MSLVDDRISELANEIVYLEIRKMDLRHATPLEKVAYEIYMLVHKDDPTQPKLAGMLSVCFQTAEELLKALDGNEEKTLEIMDVLSRSLHFRETKYLYGLKG